MLHINKYVIGFAVIVFSIFSACNSNKGSKQATNEGLTKSAKVCDKDTAIIINVRIQGAIACFCAYVDALGSMWVINKPDERPYFVTTKPLIVKQILLPKETKIIYNKRYFWQNYEQNKLLNEKNITQISLKDGTTIYWGGVPITSIVKFLI